MFDEQLYQFSRYLTIAAARPGTQPMNLVGIWAEGLDAPWGGKWTLNINAELNTWPAETTGLAECSRAAAATAGGPAGHGTHGGKGALQLSRFCGSPQHGSVAAPLRG